MNCVTAVEFRKGTANHCNQVPICSHSINLLPVGPVCFVALRPLMDVRQKVKVHTVCRLWEEHTHKSMIADVLKVKDLWITNVHQCFSKRVWPALSAITSARHWHYNTNNWLDIKPWLKQNNNSEKQFCICFFSWNLLLSGCISYFDLF